MTLITWKVAYPGTPIQIGHWMRCFLTMFDPLEWSVHGNSHLIVKNCHDPKSTYHIWYVKQDHQRHVFLSAMVKSKAVQLYKTLLTILRIRATMLPSFLKHQPVNGSLILKHEQHIYIYIYVKQTISPCRPKEKVTASDSFLSESNLLCSFEICGITLRKPGAACRMLWISCCTGRWTPNRFVGL